MDTRLWVPGSGLVSPDGRPVESAAAPEAPIYGVDLYETDDGTGIDVFDAQRQIADLRARRVPRATIVVKAGHATPTLAAEAEVYGAAMYAWHHERRELAPSEIERLRAAALKRARRRAKHQKGLKS